MAQGPLAGATSYNGQSLNNVRDDIKRWIKRTIEVKPLITSLREEL